MSFEYWGGDRNILFQGAQKGLLCNFYILLSHCCSHRWHSAKFSNDDELILCHCCLLFLELFQFLSGVDAWCKMCSDGGLPSEMQDLELAIHHHQTLYEQVTQAYTEVCAPQSNCEYLLSNKRHVTTFRSLAFPNELGFPFHFCNSFKDRVRPNPRL